MSIGKPKALSRLAESEVDAVTDAMVEAAWRSLNQTVQVSRCEVDDALHAALAAMPRRDDRAGIGVGHNDLCDQIDVLLSLNKDGALVPHGIGGLARDLLTKARAALTSERQQ